jgi:hypothetical protein
MEGLELGLGPEMGTKFKLQPVKYSELDSNGRLKAAGAIGDESILRRRICLSVLIILETTTTTTLTTNNAWNVRGKHMR